MFGIVYVILSLSEDLAPAEAIARSLAPFQAGTRGDLPDDKLAFDDQTLEVKELHRTIFTFTVLGREGLRIEGGDTWYLDTDKVRKDMSRRGLHTWTLRMADLEPDLDRFFDRFVCRLERHPVSGGYGMWRNPLGRWDWWDLGGRFDGRITGHRRRDCGRRSSAVSSGPNAGRALLESMTDALGTALGQEPAPEIDVRADDNIELVSRLLDDARQELEHAFPNALLLPPGSMPDDLRWIDTWPEIRPVEAVRALDLPDDAGWRTIVTRVYERFADHWAAGVAYHF